MVRCLADGRLTPFSRWTLKSARGDELVGASECLMAKPLPKRAAISGYPSIGAVDRPLQPASQARRHCARQ